MDDQAYRYMAQLLSQGWEFPDASIKAAMRYKVDVDQLRARYDDEQFLLSTSKGAV